MRDRKKKNGLLTSQLSSTNILNREGERDSERESQHNRRKEEETGEGRDPHTSFIPSFLINENRLPWSKLGFVVVEVVLVVSLSR